MPTITTEVSRLQQHDLTLTSIVETFLHSLTNTSHRTIRIFQNLLTVSVNATLPPSTVVARQLSSVEAVSGVVAAHLVLSSCSLVSPRVHQQSAAAL